MAPLWSRDEYTELPNPRGAELVRLTLGFTITAGIFVIFRLSIRANRKLLGWDDLWIGIAMIFSILLAATIVESVQCGFGMREALVPQQEQNESMFWWYLNQVFYKCITWPTKISILLLYRRVFLVVGNVKAYGIQFRYLVWGVLALVIGCFISFETAGIFQCTPIRYAWNKSGSGYCTATLPRMYAYAGCNFLTDLMILLLPMPLINGMTHLPKQQRIGLMGIFALGGFVCVTTLIRISKLHIKDDVLYSGRDSIAWSAIEANVGIICACLPLLRSVFIYLMPWFDSRASSRRPSRPQVGENSLSESRSPRTLTHQDTDTTSLNSSENVIIEKPQGRVHLESNSSRDYESDEAQMRHDGRDQT